MNTIALRKDAFGIARIVGKFYPRPRPLSSTVEISLVENDTQNADHEARQLMRSALDLRRQVPAFDLQIKSRRLRSKRMMTLADNVHSTIFAIGSAIAMVGGITRIHKWVHAGAILMVLGVLGAMVAGIVATFWDMDTQALIKRRQTIFQRALRYEAMAQAIRLARR